MPDTVHFFIGIILGTLVGSLLTLVYHFRQARHEARQHYIRLSLAQAEVVTLERSLEIHRQNSSGDTRQIETLVTSESEASAALPLTPTWMTNREPSAATGTASDQAPSQTGES